MTTICVVYRRACRELALNTADRQLLNKLLRELAINTVQQRLAWNIKEQFLTLWFISAGRFPELANTPITGWIAKQLPFELNENEL